MRLLMCHKFIQLQNRLILFDLSPLSEHGRSIVCQYHFPQIGKNHGCRQCDESWRNTRCFPRQQTVQYVAMEFGCT